MHTFAIKEKARGGGLAGRFFCHFEVPNNPVCWLFGHFPKVKVTHYGRGAENDPDMRRTNVWVECRVCGLRYSPPAYATKVRDDDWKARELDYKKRLIANGPGEGARGRDGYGHSKVELGAELYLYKPTKARFRSGWGFRLHVGGRGSETPFDAHFEIPLFAGYWKIGGIGGRYAEWLGRGHKRDISLSIHGGQLWWKLWYDDDGGHDDHHRCEKWKRPPWPWSMGRHKYRSWRCLRDGNIELNPVDAWFGSPKYHYDKSEEWRTALVVIGQFPGDEYLVKFRREPWVRHRDHGPRWARRVLERGVGVEFDAHIRSEERQPGEPSEQPGIPYRNHDWKGDEVLSGGVRTPEGGWPEDWLPAAVQALKASIIADRERYGYRPPNPARESGRLKTVGEF